MKKVILFIFLFLSFINTYASHINQMIFLGDSLSDNGNLYKLLAKILPKSPPYYEGRFSNGRTWAEHVGDYYYNKSFISYKIYAMGGATTVPHLPTDKFIAPTNLGLEVTKYLTESVLNDKSKAFFTIWIGANDYLFYYDEDTGYLTNRVIDQIHSSISLLYLYGANNFLIFNLPDLARIPFIKGNPSADKLHTLTVVHNLKLDALMKQIKMEHPDIKLTFINIYDLFNEIIDHPEIYNQKYNIHLTDTQEACWKGGYLGNKKFVENEIKQTFLTQTQNHAGDEETISDLISRNPELLNTFNMIHSGLAPCDNADEHLFWDAMHPSKVVHQILSQFVVEALGDQLG